MGMLINIDNGGTLTDVCAIDGDRVHYTKTLTTPYDLSQCFFAALRKVSSLVYGEERLGDLLQQTDYIRYSSTQGTNALVEKKGQRIGLILDEHHTAELLRGDRSSAEMFDALVGERVQFIAPSLAEESFEAAVAAATNTLAAEGANRITVTFSGDDYKEREKRFKRIFLMKFQRHKLGAIPLLCASELVDDHDDARRAWSAIFNSFLHPAMERFLYSAEHGLRSHRFNTPLLIFRNDGGSSRIAKTVAIKTYSSGPEGGAGGARAFAEYYGIGRLLMMDIGGTTTDVCLVEDARVRVQRYGAIEGVPISFSLSDISSYGVGGSSIISVHDGKLRVGPESVGAAPGPACFGQGGEEPTITDGLLLMGVLDPASYFGGNLALDPDRAASAVNLRIADPLGATLEDALDRMYSAWVATVARRLGDYTEIQPDTTLLAFGGAGAVAACAIAEAANIRTVAIPAKAAVFSAYGIGFSDITHHYEQHLQKNTAEEVRNTYAEMRDRAKRDMYAEGFRIEDCRLDFSLAISNGNDENLLAIADDFTGLPSLQADSSVALRLSAVKPIAHAKIGNRDLAQPCASTRTGFRRVLLQRQWHELPVYAVGDQAAGATGVGPAIIEDPYYTCVLLPGWTFQFTPSKDIMLTKRSEGLAA